MNKIMLTTTSLLAGAALALGGVVSANAATPSPAPSTSSASTCTLGEHFVSAWLEVPKAMRADLKAARADTGAARKSALKAVRTKALDGGYGSAVEAQAKWRQSHKSDITGIRPLPDNLKADLKTLHGEKGKAAKLTEANSIADKALAGGYGAKVETLAKGLMSSPIGQNCTPTAKSTSGS
jgi:hypothetical protein